MVKEATCEANRTRSKIATNSEEPSSKAVEEGSFHYEDVVTLQVPEKEVTWSTPKQRSLLSYLLHCCRKPRSQTSWKIKHDTRGLDNVAGEQAQSNYSTSIKHSVPLCQLTAKQMGNGKSGGMLELSDTTQTDEMPDDSQEPNMVWTTNFLAALSILLIIITFPFSLLYCVRVVAEYERAVVLRMGNLIPKGKGTKGPGLFFILPCIDSVRKVDLRTVTFAIPPQELLTRDSVTVSVDAVVYYRVLNPVASVLNVEDATRSTRLLAQTTIRNVLGTKDLAQILMDRDEISTAMQSGLDSTTDAWGVKVERVEIKDVRLPVQLQRAMAAEAEAAREARAKIIAAKGEQEAARSLKKAAHVISTSPLAFQLRYLQTLCAISAEKNSTILFPVPIDMMQTLGTFTESLSAGKFPSWMPPMKTSTNEHVSTPVASTIGVTKFESPRESFTQDDADAHSDTV